MSNLNQFIENKQSIFIILIIGGILLILYGSITYHKDKVQLYVKRCTQQTQARIDGFDDEKKIVRKQRHYLYYEKYTKAKLINKIYTTPIVLFQDRNGQEYRVTYLRPIEKKLNIGQKVNISYNPENPYEIIIKGDKHFKTNSKTAIETGLFLIIITIFCMVYF